ncbi:Protein NPGR2 [Glycine max]|nr:Protein NPGR2 [Glycine max]
MFGGAVRVDELSYSSESLATRDYSASGGLSSRPGEIDTKVDNTNIEEAESSLRESGYLNYEEARALLGRLEYQKGNIEAGLHVFEGIDTQDAWASGMFWSLLLSQCQLAEGMMRESDPYIVLHLCLEYAEQRKLSIAFDHEKKLIKLEGGSSVSGYILLARILSAQQKFVDAELVIDAALDQSGKWDQDELLRTKAKLRIAQGKLKNAVETHTLAVLQVQNKSLGTASNVVKNKGNRDRSLEMDIWLDLANVYPALSKWQDAEVCLVKSEAINPYSASRWHTKGLLFEARGLHREALKSYRKGLDIEPNHVPSLISTACVLRQLGDQSSSIVRSLLTDALRLDRTNPPAWYNPGLLYKANLGTSAMETVECFEAAAFLEESSSIELFR